MQVVEVAAYLEFADCAVVRAWECAVVRVWESGYNMLYLFK